MTEESMRLIELVQKSDDGDFLKMIAETALQRIMDADVDNMIGAARHELSIGAQTGPPIGVQKGYPSVSSRLLGF